MWHSQSTLFQRQLATCKAFEGGLAQIGELLQRLSSRNGSIVPRAVSDSALMSVDTRDEYLMSGSLQLLQVPDSQYGTELTRVSGRAVPWLDQSLATDVRPCVGTSTSMRVQFDDAALQGLATIVRLENLRLADVVFSRISY
ncbi:hypothetical protein E4U37_000003 [Claviceps purpurea]|nr:hypothetical protein E4U37_000003 [Claviceps purpurea]